MTSLSHITGIDRELLREKFELEPLQFGSNERENLVFMSPTVLLRDSELKHGGFLGMGAKKVLSLVTKDILESKDHTLFQVPEITCLHMGYGMKSANKEGRMAISEKDAKTWLKVLNLSTFKLEAHDQAQEDTQGNERTEAMEVDSQTRMDSHETYDDTVYPCDSGLFAPQKGSRILFMSILIINSTRRQEKGVVRDYADGEVAGEESVVAGEVEREGKIGANKMSDFLSFWTLPFLLNYSQRKVEEMMRHHQAAGKDPQSLVKTVRKSAWDIITQATQSRPEILPALRKKLEKYFSAEKLQDEYTLLKSDDGSPIVLVPLLYVYHKGKGDPLRIEDIGRKWESERGEVLSREQFVSLFVRKRDIQMDYFECMKDAKLRQGVDYAIIFPGKSGFELLLKMARDADANVLTELKCVRSQGRGMISSCHAVVKSDEGNLVVSFTYLQGTDRRSVAALFRAIGAHYCNHFTVVFLYGSTCSMHDADCTLGNLYPVRVAKELAFKYEQLQKTGKKKSFSKGISTFVGHYFPESYQRCLEKVCSDDDVTVAKELFTFEPTFDASKHLKVAFAKSKHRESLRNACLQEKDKVRNSNLRKLSKYEIHAANLDGHLLSMIHQCGRKDNIGVILAINNTLLEPIKDPLTCNKLKKAMNKVISYFVMAIIQAGLRRVFPSERDNEDRETIESGSSSSGSDSDMEVDAGPSSSQSGIVTVSSNPLASHEAPVERVFPSERDNEDRETIESGSSSSDDESDSDIEVDAGPSSSQSGIVTVSSNQLASHEAPVERVSSVEDVQDVESSSIVTKDGGSVSVKGVKLTCPTGAVDDPVTIKLKLEEPYTYCGVIVHHGLENDVIFGAPIINYQPNGQMFKKHAMLTVALDNEIGKSTGRLLVLHGIPTNDGKIIWEDITQNSQFDLEKEELQVKINKFSVIAVLSKLTRVPAQDIVNRSNFMSFKYTLSVLFKSNHQRSHYDELALVFMSQDIYQERLYKEHENSALKQLKCDDFSELGSNIERESGYIYNTESLTVSIQLGEDYKPVHSQEVHVESSVWWSTGHVIRVPLHGSSADAKILSGRVIVKGHYGHVLEDHFGQSDLCGDVRHLLGVEKVIFNLTPVVQKLGLPEETLNQVVACWKSEAEQLNMVLQSWLERQGNTEGHAVLKALEGLGLEPEEYTVKERGQMHIKHLRELAVTIEGLQHNDPNTMKCLGHQIISLCNSVLRDCSIEIATPEMEFNVATTENYAPFLEIHGQISGDVARKYKQMHSSPEDSITRKNFLMIVPQLIQAIKEIFGDKRIPQTQSGLRGVTKKETLEKILSDIQEAARNENMFRLLSEVCNILENLCLNNNGNRCTEDEIRDWGRSASFVKMLQFLENFFQRSEAQRLYKRLQVFSVSIREILSNPMAYKGRFLSDFHNVALSLLQFAKFDPSQLVRFELNDTTNSSNTQRNDVLKYDKSTETFSQLFWIRKESEDELQLEAIAHVHINGHIRTIGAFETLIILPASCNEAIDKVPIASLSVAVKREHDKSGNLRVALYAMQKENIRKALECLEKELGEDLVDSKQTEITQSHLKVRSRKQEQEAGTVAGLLLIHKWGSETIVLDSKYFVALPDLTAEGTYVPDPDLEIAGTSDSRSASTENGNGKRSSSLFDTQTSRELRVKQGRPDKDELENLARHLTSFWQKLGRRLNIEDAQLQAFHKQYDDFSEKAYQMLLHWKQRDGSAATYQVLYNALCDSLVSRRDLAENYCCDGYQC